MKNIENKSKCQLKNKTTTTKKKEQRRDKSGAGYCEGGQFPAIDNR